MARLSRKTVTVFIVVGIALTILGLAGTASGQITRSRASAQVLVRDLNSSSSGEAPNYRSSFLAETSDNLKSKVETTLPASDSGSTNRVSGTTPEVAANDEVA